MSASRNDVVKNVKRKDVLTSENADDLAQTSDLSAVSKSLFESTNSSRGEIKITGDCSEPLWNLIGTSICSVANSVSSGISDIASKLAGFSTQPEENSSCPGEQKEKRLETLGSFLGTGTNAVVKVTDELQSLSVDSENLDKYVLSRNVLVHGLEALEKMGKKAMNCIVDDPHFTHKDKIITMNSGETPLFSASQAELISFTSFFAGRKGELIYRDLQELSLKASSLARSLLKDANKECRCQMDEQMEVICKSLCEEEAIENAEGVICWDILVEYNKFKDILESLSIWNDLREIIRNDEEIFGVHEKQKLIKENNFWMEFQEEDEATLLSFCERVFKELHETLCQSYAALVVSAIRQFHLVLAALTNETLRLNKYTSTTNSRLEAVKKVACFINLVKTIHISTINSLTTLAAKLIYAAQKEMAKRENTSNAETTDTVFNTTSTSIFLEAGLASEKIRAALQLSVPVLRFSLLNYYLT
ncbi:uncharacterized protein LOC135146096 [Zophobas morio]|uniref:uncharacterized protein LOC135146096 n=1 Tax=Zophobas morio TaxID=2755281 RepID=UPI00308309F1